MSTESPWILPGGRIVRSVPGLPAELLDPGRGRWSDDLSRPTCRSVSVTPLTGIWYETGDPPGEPFPETVGSHENDLAETWGDPPDSPGGDDGAETD